MKALLDSRRTMIPVCFILVSLWRANAYLGCLGTERDRLRILRESLASRRRTLSAAKLQSPRPSSRSSGISREAQELGSLSATIARARSGLVQELVEVFHVVEVGGRPPIGGKAGTKGEWTIGDLILPVPGDIRRECLPVDSIFPFALCSIATALLVRVSAPSLFRLTSFFNPTPIRHSVAHGSHHLSYRIILNCYLAQR